MAASSRLKMERAEFGCGTCTSFGSPVYIHYGYKFDRTWLVPLTLGIYVAIHPQSG